MRRPRAIDARLLRKNTSRCCTRSRRITRCIIRVDVSNDFLIFRPIAFLRFPLLETVEASCWVEGD